LEDRLDKVSRKGVSDTEPLLKHFEFSEPFEGRGNPLA